MTAAEQQIRQSTGPRNALTRVRAAIPYVLALLLFGMGLYALHRLLAPVDIKDVMAQVRSTPMTTVAMALLATMMGYLSLVGYDWSALRYIGKPLPLPVTVTGGLMAYAFGNTIGLSAVSGGAVRYRIYSGLGLDGYDVAAVSTFAAVSFGVAATVVGLGALALHPTALGALAPFPPPMMRLLAIAAIAASVVPLAWASLTNKSLRIGRWRLRAPSVPILGGQIGFSCGDIGFSALTLYLLMPTGDLGFFTFLAIFAVATMAGVVSHVPGGIGVFETAMIAALPASVPVGQAAAALLLFRLTYYLVPFVLAIVVLAVYESLVITRGRMPGGAAGRALAAVSPALKAAGPLVPLVSATMVFGSGLWMSFSALLPPTSEAAEFMESVFPLAFVEGGALLSSLIGVGLVILSHALMRRNSAAYLLTLAALGTGAVAALLHGLDYERALLLLAVLLILLPFRREFRRRSNLLHEPLSLRWIVLFGLLVFSAGFILFFAYKNTTFSYELWWQYAADERAPRAFRAGLLGALALSVLVLIMLLRSPRVHPAPPTPAEIAHARQIVGTDANPDEQLVQTGDKSVMFSDDGKALVMYGVRGRSWIALGGPVGPADSAAEVAFAFVDAARNAGARPAFYEVGHRSLPQMLDLGLNLFKIGEEAVVDLTAFSLDGDDRADLRAAHERAERHAMTLDISTAPHDAALAEELRGISDEWLRLKQTREKGFAAGGFDAAWLNLCDIAVVRHEGRIVAFASILRGGTGQRASVDLLRHTSDAPAGVMGFLFTELMLRLKAEGYGEFSLGMAPLSGDRRREGARIWNRFGAAIFRHGRNFDTFEGLRAFKERFDPEWRARYVAAPSTVAPLAVLTDASILIAGGTEALSRT